MLGRRQGFFSLWRVTNEKKTVNSAHKESTHMNDQSGLGPDSPEELFGCQKGHMVECPGYGQTEWTRQKQSHSFITTDCDSPCSWLGLSI